MAEIKPTKISPWVNSIVGQRFGRLVIVSHAGTQETSRLALWNCVCDCGGTRTTTGRSLRAGTAQSCGCLQKEATSRLCKTHGHGGAKRSGTTYASWDKMIQRCTNPNNDGWDDYGGRGITVCERWHAFENFLADMGERPSPKHSIDRFPDNDGNYSPGNCRWATAKEQQRNRRNNRMLAWKGETKCLEEWSEITGMKRETIRARLRAGWSVDEALGTPRLRQGERTDLCTSKPENEG